MPPVQTAYLETQPAALEGMVVNSEPLVVVSRVAQLAIGFGKVAVQGAAGDNRVRPSAADALAFQGITVKDVTLPARIVGDATPVDTFAIGEIVPVMLKGVVWVLNGAAGAVAKNEPAYFVPATGIITNTANAAANPPIPGGTFDSSGATGTLVKLRLS